ncbi:MAG: cryptochrome/photolyase family protein [Bryobacteraceae bacterium]
MRNLVIVLGDQLNDDSAVYDGFERTKDAIWMAEVAEESTHVWSHKARITLFLSAMRHYERRMTHLGRCVFYRRLEDRSNSQSLRSELLKAIAQFKPEGLVMAEPGDYRVRKELEAAARQARIPLEIRIDRHFLSTVDEFRAHAQGRKQLRMEYFYREMRRRHGVLMDAGRPVGGEWNLDKRNREHFGADGPVGVPAPLTFKPDRITREVIDAVELRFRGHPGLMSGFDWPVTPEEAEAALQDFIANRLPWFGAYQDAMWTEEPWLFHSRLAAAMNLKLLDPRRVIVEAEAAYHSGSAPLACVEGFIRQILGWREYVRGVYWTQMPGYLGKNELGATNSLPKFFWTGKTEMNCLRQAITQTLDLGYAHHIQRLMVTGLYCLLAGINPKEVHEWYLAVYVDAVEWVELPNTLGMSQYADGGIMASKPYAASGKYIDRMSNYCKGCKYKPNSCPMTEMYWQFLEKHETKLSANPRMAIQLKNMRGRNANSAV